MSVALRGLHEQLRPAAEYALQVGRYYGLTPQVTSVLRSYNDQARLYAAYRASVEAGTFRKPGGVQYPANPPGTSAHEYGLAWDSVVPAEQQDAWDYIRRALGWTVLTNDRIHAELPNWRQYVQRPA